MPKIRCRIVPLVTFVAGTACGSSAMRHPSGSARPGDTVVKRESYKALIIGVWKYQHFKTLQAPKNDAKQLAALLRDEYNFDVVVLPPEGTTEDEVTSDQIKTAFEQLDVTEPDRLLIYFSGHGEPDKGRSRVAAGYWLPSNATTISEQAWKQNPSQAALDANWISRDDFVAEQVKRLRAGHILVVDDSCYAGGITRIDAGTDDPSSSDRPPAVLSTSEPETTVGQSSHEARSSGKTVDSAPESIAAWRYKRVRTWLTAGGDEVVLSNEKSSLFTRHFLDVLRQNDGATSGTGVFLRVRERMLADRERQTPDYLPIARADHKGGDFLFIRRTYSVDQRELSLGHVSVRVASLDDERRRVKVEEVAKLVLNQLIDIDAGAKAIRPGDKPRPLYLTVSMSAEDELVLSLVDRQDDQILTTERQRLSQEHLTADVRAAVSNLHRDASSELHGKDISVDIVRKALIAQRTQTWNVFVSGSAAAYVDFEDESLLTRPALGLRLGADYNIAPWFLLGVVGGLDTTRSETSRSSVLGDLADGTYSNNRLVGEVALQTASGLLRATVRAPHGLVLPYGYASAGLAYLAADLSDEYYVPASESDVLPVNLVNHREDTSAWAFAWELGAGAHFVLSSHLSLLAQANFFKAHHDMKIVSQIAGLNQAKSVTTDFQPIQTVAIQAGAAALF